MSHDKYISYTYTYIIIYIWYSGIYRYFSRDDIYDNTEWITIKKLFNKKKKKTIFVKSYPYERNATIRNALM